METMRNNNEKSEDLALDLNPVEEELPGYTGCCLSILSSSSVLEDFGWMHYAAAGVFTGSIRSVISNRSVMERREKEGIMPSLHHVWHSSCALEMLVGLYPIAENNPPGRNIKKMNVQEKAKDLIQSNFSTLINEMDGSDLAQWLFQHGVLSKQELAGTEKTSRRILVNLFRKKDNSWVPIFMNFLKTKYFSLYRLVVGTNENLSKLQRHDLMAKLYQSGVSANFTAQILRENIRRNIARLSISYAPPSDGWNMKDNQSALIDLLGRSDDDWVFPFVNFCKKNLQKMAFEEIFGINLYEM